jgi:hypothetical protein
MCPTNEANYEHPNWNRSPTLRNSPNQPFYGPQKTLPHVKELDKIKDPKEVPYKKFKAGL